jgi:hypothetical protein
MRTDAISAGACAALFLLPPLQQGVASVNAVYNWWYQGWGIGGWFIFLLLAIAAIAGIFFDSHSRRVAAIGWKVAAVLTALLILPTVFYKFSNMASQEAMVASGVLEPFFFLGVVGGIVPVASAIGYAINYVGYQPLVAEEATLPPAPAFPQPHAPEAKAQPAETPPQPVVAPAPKPARHYIGAWLIELGTNRSYQLYQGDTRIGRSRQNDIVFDDKAVSREHILIREEQGRYTLYDRGSRSGTIVNGQRMSGPLLLADGDTIEIGDIRLRFTTSG